jgi:hypothetical protein
MRVNDLYKEKIYPELKEYLTTNSIYSPTVSKIYTEQSKIFPIVTVQLVREKQIFNTLTWGEKTYPFRIDINVYSNDKTINNTKVSKIVITDEISSLIEDYFNNNYKVSITRQDDIANIDGNIRRNFIRIDGILDTKWGEEGLTIYPASNR